MEIGSIVPLKSFHSIDSFLSVDRKKLNTLDFAARWGKRYDHGRPSCTVVMRRPSTQYFVWFDQFGRTLRLVPISQMFDMS